MNHYQQLEINNYELFDNTQNNKKLVLDMTCSTRSMHLKKQNNFVVYQDKRQLQTKSYGKNIIINPDIICDYTNMAYKDNYFDLVIFDPPHLTETYAGTGHFKIIYSSLPDDYATHLRNAFNEAYRVLRPGGTLIFKWADTCFTLDKIIRIIERQPLIAQRSSKTAHFAVFYKQHN